MTQTLLARVWNFAQAHRADPKWRRRLHAMNYGCRSLQLLSKLK